MKDRKIEVRLIFLSEIDDRKERKKVKKFSKQMAFSSQKHRMKKEEGATAAASPTFSQYSGLLRLFSSGRSGSVLPWKSPNIGKLPLTTTNVPTTKRRLLDFCLALQNRTNTKKQMSLRSRLKTRMKITQNN